MVIDNFFCILLVPLFPYSVWGGSFKFLSEYLSLYISISSLNFTKLLIRYNNIIKAV